jgi:type I restriction enzyme, S subunit
VKKRTLHVPLGSLQWSRQHDWLRLDEVCDGIYDCPHSTPGVTEIGPLLARSQDIRTGVFRWETAAHVSEETYTQRIARAEPTAGDILYSREGTYFGIAAEIPAGHRVCLGQRMVLLRPNMEKINSRFLRYWLNSPVLTSHILGFRDGSVAERLNMPTILALPIPDFPRSDQDNLAEILGSLDDKVELNRKMNRTLAALAEATFKEWFVEFGPVLAKAAHRSSFPGMSQDVFDQLPDLLVESELGAIPDGWECVPFSDLVDLLSGGTPKRAEPGYWGGNIPWFSVRDAPDEGDVWVIDTQERITEAGSQNSAAKIMPEGTTIISARGTVGRLGMTAVPMAMNQSCYGVRGRDGIEDFFVYFSLLNAVTDFQRHTHGSVFDTITRSTFETLKTLRPQQLSLLREFERVVSPHMLLIKSNRFQAQSLVKMRDALLPKLFSGEIEIPDVGGASGERA